MKKITRDEFKKRRQAKGFCACNNCIDDEIRLQEAIKFLYDFFGIEPTERVKPLSPEQTIRKIIKEMEWSL